MAIESQGEPRTVDADTLRRHLDRPAVIECVRTALIAHAQGQTVAPRPLHLQWDTAADCHVKAGYLLDGSLVVIKLATSVYDNPTRGLPSNSGMVIALDRTTGRATHLLRDDALVTAWRTAAVGALAGHALSRTDASTVAVFGTGLQAELQVTWLAQLRRLSAVHVIGRNPASVDALVSRLMDTGLPSVHASAADEGLAASDIVITTTPSAAPLFEGRHVRPGTHLTAVGADMPGKQELPADLLGRASVVVSDDPGQSAEHGDASHAIAAELLSAAAIVSLGDILHGVRHGRTREEDITVADLTGVGAIDAALTEQLISRLGISDATGAAR